MMQLCSLDIDSFDSPMNSPSVTDEPKPSSRKAPVEEFQQVGAGVIISGCSTIGKRDHNLDKFSFSSGQGFEMIAVFDGHGDSTVSNYLQTHLLEALKLHPQILINFEMAVRDTFAEVDAQLFGLSECHSLNSGSTALILLITESDLYVINLGDSRAVSISDNDDLCQLNTQHNLLNGSERKMVVNRGGLVLKKGRGYRLLGELNISRSFGDFKYKPAVSIVPQVRRFSKAGTKFIVLGTDGFWAETTTDQVKEVALSSSHVRARQLLDSLCKRPSDNATVVMYQLQ